MNTVHFRFIEIDPIIEQQIEALIARMNLQDKVWQMVQTCQRALR